MNRRLREVARAVSRRRPGVDPASLVPASWAAARRMIEEYVAAGLSKFVIRPASVVPGVSSLERFIEEFVAEMTPLQT